MKDATLESALIRNIRQAMPQLIALQGEIEPERLEGYYRFYHHSFKVYHLQHFTQQMVSALQGLLPERPINEWFRQIVSEGTGKEWEASHNQDWLQHTLPILQAFDHARYFLDAAVLVGSRFEKPCEDVLPYEYAGLLYLFDLR